MADEVASGSEIKESDIVFDCPNCGKSLAVDYRGAGLSIPCPDCSTRVVVPIPEYMEISDIDSDEHDQEVRLQNLRKALTKAEMRIQELMSDVDELQSRRESLERTRTDSMRCFREISSKLTVMQRAMEGIVEAMEDVPTGDSMGPGGVAPAAGTTAPEDS